MRADTVLLLSNHRKPVPPLPSLAKMSVVPQAVVLWLIVGAAGTEFMTTTTDDEVLVPAAEVVTA
jgi:hypothetical protein